MKQPPPVPPDPPSPSPAPETPLGQDAGMRLVLPVGRSIWAIIAGYLGLLARKFHEISAPANAGADTL